MTIARRDRLEPTNSRYLYSAYGLNIESEVEIPELPELPELPVEGSDANVKLVRGCVPESLEDARNRGGIFYTTRHQTLLLLQGRCGANFLISDGNEIRVDFQNHSQLPQIRLAILGYCFTALMFQKEYLVLHGNALATAEGAIAICGHQKAGKSTTTFGLYKRGYSVIADDLTAVTTNAYPKVQPGFPRLKLWADTLTMFGESSECLTRILPDREKFSFPVDQGFHKQPEVLNTVFILQKACIQKATARRLAGVEKLVELSNQVRSYTPDQLPHGSLWGLKACTALAEKIRVVEIIRPEQGDSIEQVLDLIALDQQQNA